MKGINVIMTNANKRPIMVLIYMCIESYTPRDDSGPDPQNRLFNESQSRIILYVCNMLYLRSLV